MNIRKHLSITLGRSAGILPALEDIPLNPPRKRLPLLPLPRLACAERVGVRGSCKD